MAGAVSQENGGENETASDSLPDLETQKNDIKELINTTLQKGDTWYLIDCRWFKHWKKFVGFDSWDVYGAGEAVNNPGPLDNSNLFTDDRVTLKDHLIDELDYNLVPEAAWHKLVSWYGLVNDQQPISRQVVEHGMYVRHCKVEVYLMEFKLCENSDMDTVVTQQFSKGDTIGHIVSTMKNLFSIPEESETRLWNKYMSNTFELLSNMEQSVQDAGLYQGQTLVIEQQNEDGSWQRQNTRSSYSSSTITSSSADNGYSSSNNSSSYSGYGSGRYWSNLYDNKKSYRGTPGLTGLANLGNTCFMNSGLQCLSNTMTLTKYFLSKEYVDELNTDNPLGMKGEIAKAYADLLNQIWSGQSSSIAPRQFKMQVGRFAPQFSGYQQQDSHELLAFLLDGLHEDLNRIKMKPYIELRDADGRPDQVVASEAWHNHRQRNDSIIVDIFHGLFKSTLVCPECNKISVTFDPLCYLSLPLPVKKERNIECFLIKNEPMEKPVQFKLTVPKMGSVADMCAILGKQAGVPKDKLVVTDVYNNRFHKIFKNTESLTTIMDRDDIFIYEVSERVDNPEYLVLPVYQRKKGARLASYTYGSSSKVLFGIPLLISVPKKGLVYSELYKMCLNKMRRYVTAPEEKDDDVENGDDKTDKTVCNGPDVEMNEAESGDSDAESDEELEKAYKNVSVNGDEEEDKADTDEETPTVTNPKTEVTEKPTKKTRLFSLTLVNMYGSTDMHALADDGKPLKLSHQSYLSLDWTTEKKEKYYNTNLSEETEEDESVARKPTQRKSVVQLNDCIQLFLTREKLGANDPWYCPQCKKHQQASKKFDLWCLPEVLVIHLKRFSYTSLWRDKIDTLVNFPLCGLDMSDYVIGKDGPPPLYDLIGVSNHYGGMGGGHYTAYCRNHEDDHWYSYDDSSVSQINEEQIVSKAAYVLFYKRRCPHGNGLKKSEKGVDSGTDERMSETGEESASEQRVPADEEMDTK
ncbi:ubiquitin carboxyl-terminal hydrolase 4 [Nematostella vectensis]|uniref:ubiquitin carboxyl-terminal hydrolase 4 n=1 Tax=Nematostella vectensis TaxID=45351 RepID=UPI0020775B92|nr:ubiquitin carboxyl-terminal hydrolase 4 [Nematostella vectensis]